MKTEIRNHQLRDLQGVLQNVKIWSAYEEIKGRIAHYSVVYNPSLLALHRGQAKAKFSEMREFNEVSE